MPSWYPEDAEDIRGCFFREQALALLNVGIQVGVVTVELRSLRRWRTLFDRSHGIFYENDHGINTLRFKTMYWFPRMPRLINRLSLFGGIKAFELYIQKYGKPDLIHVHSCLHMGAVALYIKKKYGIPYIVTEHSSGYIRNLYTGYEINCTENILKQSNKLVAISQIMGSFFRQKFTTQKHWEIIPNIVNAIFFERSLYKRSNNESFKFINVAFMNKNKMQINIIKAVESLYNQGIQDIELIIVGDGSEKKNLEEYIKQNNIPNIKLLGLQNREFIADIMVQCDCFVLSSEVETFGVVVIEALASGLPVVATRCGGPEDIVNPTNGLLVEKNNVEELASAMKKIKESDGVKYNNLAIRNACYENYSESAVVNKLMTIYNQVK
ncbi:glycosyltransferase [Acinetobacter sp. C26M]|nr:glycosyltransferase [Acinetobacter sp. C26M]USA51858.1 glycosyltransferase [Acinetobacter sp. C26G]